MTLLAIDTARGVTSLAVGRGRTLLASCYDKIPNQQASGLLTLIDDTLNQAQCSLQEISGIICSTGPGGFTSVRIGIAVARGLAFATSIPCHGIASMDIMAFYMRDSIEEDCIFECVIPAGRKDHAVQSFRIIQGRAMAASSMQLRRNIDIDDSVTRCSSDDNLGTVIMPQDLYASTMIRYMTDMNITDYHSPKPLYIRPPDAIAATPFLKNTSLS